MYKKQKYLCFSVYNIYDIYDNIIGTLTIRSQVHTGYT